MHNNGGDPVSFEQVFYFVFFKVFKCINIYTKTTYGIKIEIHQHNNEQKQKYIISLKKFMRSLLCVLFNNIYKTNF
jgi:hypothetical protein